MNRGARLILAAVLLVGTTVGAFYVTTGRTDNVVEVSGDDSIGTPDTSAHGDLTLVSSEQCAECHREIYEEWKGSHHELAWLNPEPRRKELSDNFRNKDCIPCHAPRPMIEVGFGRRPLEREARRDDGVNCFTCHRYQNVVAAANPLGPAASGAPCNPVQWEPVKTMTLCAPCHDQHKVLQDWTRSRFAVEGEGYMDCNDCHMPPTEGPGTAGGPRKTHRGHGFAGAHDPAMLRRSATLRATIVAPGASLTEAVAALTGRGWKAPEEVDTAATRRVLIEVKNTGVGHNFPADERHRAVDLTAQHRPEDGDASEELRLTRFRNPYRHEFELVNPFKERAGEVLTDPATLGGEDFDLSQVRLLPEFNPDRKVFYVESTQLHAGESRLLWFAPPAGGGSLHLRLYYKLNPYMSNSDAVLVSEHHVDL